MINTLGADCLISLKFGTKFDYVTSNELQINVQGQVSKVKVTA